MSPPPLTVFFSCLCFSSSSPIDFYPPSSFLFFLFQASHADRDASNCPDRPSGGHGRYRVSEASIVINLGGANGTVSSRAATACQTMCIALFCMPLCCTLPYMHVLPTRKGCLGPSSGHACMGAVHLCGLDSLLASDAALAAFVLSSPLQQDKPEDKPQTKGGMSQILEGGCARRVSRAATLASCHAALAALCRYRLSFATSEKLQMSALIGAFIVARTGLVAAAR